MRRFATFVMQLHAGPTPVAWQQFVRVGCQTRSVCTASFNSCPIQRFWQSARQHIEVIKTHIENLAKPADRSGVQIGNLREAEEIARRRRAPRARTFSGFHDFHCVLRKRFQVLLAEPIEQGASAVRFTGDVLKDGAFGSLDALLRIAG